MWAELGKGLCEASSLEGVEDAVWDIDCSSRSLKTALNIISNPSQEKSRRLLHEEPSWRLRGRRLSRDTPDQAQSSCPLSFHTAPDSPQSLQPPNDMEGHRQGPGRPPVDPSESAAFLLTKPAEAAQGDSDKETCREGWLPYGKEVGGRNGQ